MNVVKELIDLCGDNLERDGFEEMLYCVLKVFLEYMEGY